MYPGHWASINPEKTAIINTLSGAQQTYGELDGRSNQLAQLLWDKGLRHGDHIAVFMDNDIRYFEVVWAALRSGLYITTINRYLTCEEAGYIVDDCEAQAMITATVMTEAAQLRSHAPNCHTWLCMDNPMDGYDDYEQAIAVYPSTPLAAQPMGGMMLYSSGTTGRPKGIKRPLRTTRLTHRRARWAVCSRCCGVGSKTPYTCRRHRCITRRRSVSAPPPWR